MKMLVLFWACSGLYLLLILGLYILSAEHVRGGIVSRRSGGAERCRERTSLRARARVIVPVTGAAPDLEVTLGSLLGQIHPNHEVVLVTRDEEDPATPVVRRLCEGVSHARHVLGGRAEGCGQKNRNLLKGLDAAGTKPEILVFCDANHWAPPHFFDSLVRPLDERQAVLASGYHRVLAEDRAMGTLGMLISVMAIHMLQGIPFITQPWGGATAVSAQAFESLDIRRIWAETVVDDYSLGSRFLKAGIRSRPVSDACLLSRLGGWSVGRWAKWLERQLMYFKVFQPVLWVLVAPAAVVLTFPLLFSAGAVLGAVPGWVDMRVALPAATFLLAFLGVASLYRRLVPEEIPWHSWIAAFALMHFTTAWCYAGTWLSNRISWRGITYEVGRGGKVKKVVCADQSESG
ncbi:MAG: glycosyltransferase [Syntrophobacteraceae bacterium]|nr:glycosyltransferase [Syntrophobacteraceae bacterium]